MSEVDVSPSSKGHLRTPTDLIRWNEKVSHENKNWMPVLRSARDEGGFHWRDDVYFKRLSDGSVRVREFSIGFNYTPNWTDIIIPASEWASIVASLSKDGETGETYHAALAFHG